MSESKAVDSIFSLVSRVANTLIYVAVSDPFEAKD